MEKIPEILDWLIGKARRKERDGDQNSTDAKLYLEESVLERKLPEADLKALVDLPAGLDYNEWLASHTLALFEHVNLVYGTISEFCTLSGCPDMTGPGNRTYLWFDEKGKKTRVAAPQYIDYVMTFTQKTVSDESIFPTKYANEFPSSFESIARKILRLQFHVIAHLYAAHFREIALLGLHTHLNLTFAHLTALHRRFTLIEEKETDVLRDLEIALHLTDDRISSDSMTAHSNYIQHNDCSHIQQNNQESATEMTIQTATTTNTIITTTAENVGITTVIGVYEDANTSSSAVRSSTISATTFVDGNMSTLPICSQPEVGVASIFTSSGFGGAGGLMGGILGDFTSNEFGDTTGYCATITEMSADGNQLKLNFNNNLQTHQHLQQQQHVQSSTHVHQYQQQPQNYSSTQQQCNTNNSNNSNSTSSSSHTTKAV